MSTTDYARATGLAILLSACGATLAAAGAPHLHCGTAKRPATLSMSSGVATWRLHGPGGVGPFAVVVTSPPAEWASAPPGVSWVGPTADGDPAAPAGNFTYTAKLKVDQCPESSAVTLSGFIAGDNGATVTLDGETVGATSNYPDGFESPNPTSLRNIIVGDGEHVLKVVVQNQAGWTGMLLQAIFTRTSQ